MRHVVRVIFLLGALCAVAAARGRQAAPAEWPQWRGPARDGVAHSFQQPDAWPAALRQRWMSIVGLGYATPLLVRNHLYVFARQGDEEMMVALDAELGQIVWQTGYKALVKLNERSGSFKHGEGPKSTPTYADGRIFSIGMSGIVTA